MIHIEHMSQKLTSCWSPLECKVHPHVASLQILWGWYWFWKSFVQRAGQSPEPVLDGSWTQTSSSLASEHTPSQRRTHWSTAQVLDLMVSQLYSPSGCRFPGIRTILNRVTEEVENLLNSYLQKSLKCYYGSFVGPVIMIVTETMCDNLLVSVQVGRVGAEYDSWSGHVPFQQLLMLLPDGFSQIKVIKKLDTLQNGSNNTNKSSQIFET